MPCARVPRRIYRSTVPASSGDRTLRDILLGPGISCSSHGYLAPERDISLLGYPAPERDISLSRYPARNQDISLARLAGYPARERDIQGPSGTSRFISLARYPARERDISLRAGSSRYPSTIEITDISTGSGYGISRFWAGYFLPNETRYPALRQVIPQSPVSRR